MRVAVLASNHAVTDARVVFKQAASLARLGHEVAVFGLEGKFPVRLPGVEIHAVYPFRVGIKGRAAAVRKLYGPALEWRPDVASCHEPESAVVGLRLRRRLGTRVLFDVHELWQETMALRAPGPVRAAARWVFSAALRRIARRVDWVTTVSPPIRDFYRAARGDDRVDIIYNSPPMDLFPPCRQDAAGPVTLVHEGSLGRGRGMVQVLEALALVRREAEVRLLIVGGVHAAEQDLFDETVARLGLAGAIDAPGWVSYEGVGPLLATGQVGLVALQPSPNNYQGLGNKLFNYMCCGLAVVAPAGSTTADLVREAGCGVAVDTTDPAAIAGAVAALARDPAERARLGAAGRRAIEETYGWHRMEERLRGIYARLA